MTYNASNHRHLRKARRDALLAAQAEARVITRLMSDAESRAWVHDLLVRAHIFSTSFDRTALGTAFAEGERNIGLQLLSMLTTHAPDQYVFMMREAQDRTTANERYNDSNNGRTDRDHAGRSGNDRGADDNSGPSRVDNYPDDDSRYDDEASAELAQPDRG